MVATPYIEKLIENYKIGKNKIRDKKEKRDEARCTMYLRHCCVGGKNNVWFNPYNFIKYFFCSFLLAYKSRACFVNCGHRHARPKNLVKGGETSLPTSWFCTILPGSPNVTNRLITEQNALTLLCSPSFFGAKKSI